MNRLEYDPSQTGLRAVFKDWQAISLHIILENPKGLNSRATWEKVNKTLGKDSISRASIINFLEDMREMGVLKGEDNVGKGGHHWIYHPNMDEAGLRRFITEQILGSLIRDFPEETKTALRKIS
jgi:hypothetical protein